MQPVYYVAFFEIDPMYKTVEDVRAKAPEAIAAHLARSNEWHRRGTLLMAGAFTSNPRGPLETMGVLTSRETAEEYAKGDPFVLNGTVRKWYIREWASILKD